MTRNPSGHGMTFTKGAKPAAWGLPKDPPLKRSWLARKWQDHKTKQAVNAAINAIGTGTHGRMKEEAHPSKDTEHFWFKQARTRVAARDRKEREDFMQKHLSGEKPKIKSSDAAHGRASERAWAKEEVVVEWAGKKTGRSGPPPTPNTLYVQKHVTRSITKQDSKGKVTHVLHAQNHPVHPDVKMSQKNQNKMRDAGAKAGARYNKINRARLAAAKEEFIPEAVFPKGPKQPHSPEIMAQVAKDMAKRKQANHALIKSVKKEVNSWVKKRKGISVVRDPMDEERKATFKNSFVKSGFRKTSPKTCKDCGEKLEGNEGKFSGGRCGHCHAMNMTPDFQKIKEAVTVDTQRWDRSAQGMAGARKGRGSWIFTKHHSGVNWDKHKEGEDHITVNDKYSVAKTKAKAWAKEKGHSHIYVAEEILPELKDVTLGRYIEKADNNLKPYKYGRTKRQEKRAKGIRRAYVKITRGDYKTLAAHEQVEPVTELKKSTYASYIKKSAEDMRDSTKDEYSGYLGSKKAGRRASKRHRGIDAAADRLAKEEVVVEGSPRASQTKKGILGKTEPAI